MTTGIYPTVAEGCNRQRSSRKPSGERRRCVCTFAIAIYSTLFAFRPLIEPVPISLPSRTKSFSSKNGTRPNEFLPLSPLRLSALTAHQSEFSNKDLKSVGNYTLGRLIGKGSFGKVYLATHKLTNGSKVRC